MTANATKAKKKHLPLPKRFNVAMTDAAYARLRKINARYGFGNNYCLTFLLENLDEIADADRLAGLFDRMTEEWGSPKEAC